MAREVEREKMVADQLIPRGISDSRVLESFRKIPRHEFAPKELSDSAYVDYPLPIGDGQTISQPYMVALMTERLQLKGNEKVLEIGTGSGYQAAILAYLAKEVYSVERFASLVEKADAVLKRLKITNVKIKVGDGTLGWEEFAPYDGIVVTAGAPSIPKSLINQLGDNARLIIPVGEGLSQVLTLVERRAGKTSVTEVCGCVFVPLIGKEGWGEAIKNG